MTMRTLLTVSVAVLVVAAGTASSATAAPTGGARTNCGTIKAAARTWLVLANGLTCRDAGALIRQLAPRVHGAGGPPFSLGTHMGMRCIATSLPSGASINTSRSTVGPSAYFTSASSTSPC